MKLWEHQIVGMLDAVVGSSDPDYTQLIIKYGTYNDEYVWNYGGYYLYNQVIMREEDYLKERRQRIIDKL